MMLVTYVDQVGPVGDGSRKIDAAAGLIDLRARVAGRLARVRPPEIEIIGRRYLLNDGQPSAEGPCAFIEGRGGGSVALHVFIEETRRSAGRLKLVLNTRLKSAFIGDTDRSDRRDAGDRGAPPTAPPTE